MVFHSPTDCAPPSMDAPTAGKPATGMFSDPPFEPHYPQIPIEKKKAIPIGMTFSFLGWVMGLEPTTPGTTIRCSAN